MSESDKIHSTGRGGAGNIGRDPNTYIDGDIVREGVEGGATSAGRGGAGNITPARGTTPVPSAEKKSIEVVPEPAMREPGKEYDNFHTGRGGGGNVYREKFGGHTKPQLGQEGHKPGLMEKAKHAIGLDKGKGGEGK